MSAASASIYDEAAATQATSPGRAEDPFFAPMGRSLVTCLLAHLVWSDPQAIDISLATFAAAIAVSEGKSSTSWRISASRAAAPWRGALLPR